MPQPAQAELRSTAPAGRGNVVELPGLPQRRRRRQHDPVAMGSPLAASFVGLLLLNQDGAAAAGGDESAAGGGGSSLADKLFGLSEAKAAVQAGALPVLVLNAEAGSVLQSSGLIDPQALTRLSGDARLGEEPGGAVLRPPLANGREVDGEVAVDAEAGSGTVLPFAEPGTTGEGVFAEEGEGLGDVGEVATGTDGDDTMIGTDGDDSLNGGAGDDTLIGLDGDDTLVGGAGDDLLDGGNGDDLLNGGSGDDTLIGGGGDDLLDGGTGNDALDGGAGNDTLAGGAGDDSLDGGSGVDEMRGGAGDDVMVADRQSDFVADSVDFAGHDALAVGEGFARNLALDLPWLTADGRTTFRLGSGLEQPPGEFNAFVQQVHPTIESVELRGDAGHDVVGDERANKVWGDEGANRIHGRGGDDSLAGQGGADSIWGGDGSDTLWGGDGDDWLEGGDGADHLYGGGGDDAFVFGLSDSAVDTAFDHEGRNTLKLLDAEGADGLTARVEGEDLVLEHNGRDVFRVDGYVGHEDSYAGVETAGGVKSLEEFLRADPIVAPGAPAASLSAPSVGLSEPASAFSTPASRAFDPRPDPASDDLLEAFFDPAAPGGPAPSAAFDPPAQAQAPIGLAEPQAQAWGGFEAQDHTGAHPKAQATPDTPFPQGDDVLAGFLGEAAPAFAPAQPDPLPLGGIEGLSAHEEHVPVAGARGLEKLAFAQD